MSKEPLGPDLLGTAEANRGAAFTLDERSSLGLKGPLPPSVEAMDQLLGSNGTPSYGAVRIATLVVDRNLARVDRPNDVDSWMRATAREPQYRS